MRFSYIKLCLVILFSSGLLIAHVTMAGGGEPLSVQWFEPKVQATQTPGQILVNLVGMTEPGVSVKVDPKSIIVIQPADANNQVIPQVGESLVKSETRGYFRLKLLMPAGLS